MRAAARLHKALVKNASSGTNYLYKYTREALASPTEGVAWSYAELNDRVHALVHGLASGAPSSLESRLLPGERGVAASGWEAAEAPPVR